jgi:uncharacterized protein YneF (UPF0154 family)
VKEMDWNNILEIIKNISIVVGVILGSYGIYRTYLYIKKTRQDLNNNKEIQDKKLKSILSAKRENRMVTIHNEGSKATILKVYVNDVDVSTASELDISDYEIQQNGDVVITIKKANNVLQPPYRLEVRYKDEYIIKYQNKTGEYYKTFKTSVG